MSHIEYDGSAESAEQIRAAINVLKSEQKIIARQDGGRLELDQEWFDGQVVRNRWTLDVGQRLDTATGAVE